MPLPFEPLQFPFRLGLSEGVDPYQAPIGTLSRAENVEWVKNGMLQRRLGMAVLGAQIFGGGSFSAGARLFVRGDELCAIDGDYVYAWSEDRSKWFRIDRVPDASMEWDTLIDPYQGVAASDSAYASGYGWTVTAWTAGDPLTFADQTRIWAQVNDADGNSLVMAPTRVSTLDVHGVRVLYDGTQAFVIYRASQDIMCRALDLTTLTFRTEQVLTSSVVTTSGFDAKIVGTDIVLAFESLPNGNLELERFTYDSGTNVYTSAASGGITSAWAVDDDFRSIAIDGAAGEVLYVAYHSTNTSRTAIATANISTMAEITAPVDLETADSVFNVSVVRVDASNAIVGWSGEELAPNRGYVATIKVSSVLALDAVSRRGTYGARLLTRLFAIGSRFFAFFLDYPITWSPVYVGSNSALMEIVTSTNGSVSNFLPHRYLGKMDVLTAGISLQGMLASGLALSATTAAAAVPFLGASPQNASENWRCGLRIATVSIGASLTSDMWRTVEYGGESYISGALLHVYDGRTVFDYGFSHAPTIGSISSLTPTAGSIGVGDYLYGFTLEYRSATGMLHRGPTEKTENAVSAGPTGTVTFSLVTTAFTSKIDAETGLSSAFQILLVPHRSVADQPNYYRMSYEPLYNTIIYDIQSASQAFVDTRDDLDIGNGTDLSRRPLIYDTGGILNDYQPPSAITMALHRDRLWLITGDRRTIWFSKSFQDDIGAAPGFHPSFRLVFNKSLTAIGSLEDKLIPMAEDGLWYVVGDGPAADGSNSDFSKATPIQTDVGCSQPRSVVSTPAGLMFANDNGIYLLTRGLEVVNVGRPVQDTFDDYPIITSATLVSRRNQVRFTCSNDAGTDGIVLVFDYEQQQWATRDYVMLSPFTAGNGGRFVDSIMWNGRWVAVAANGAVFRENLETDATAYLDAGAWFTATIETTWINRSGPTTFQRVRRAAVLAKRITDADQTIKIAVNGDDTFVETRTWDSDEADGRVGIHVAHQKSHAIKIQVSDAYPTNVGAVLGNGQGFLWSMLALELAQKRGLEKRAEGAKK